ncbi:TPA: hypothetical protein DEP34_02050 [Candidatus Uhrbacteria bacterium]|uniref:Uncharacterized protein n=2 Tax=Candidatus Uhriibacteriota TaxID=1752732 RepID=A0A0G1Q7T5_9BACT|nr:MAG: hypothetical protein UX45_C0014G0007 [Candidatus Uhrbacteria bacterium GW2011_GWF2_46_218]KKU40917.1 MAG: hypothetical protein UX57_C0008G0029 [Candidatus Uhrbacteria bacterium GW2011_GWE2_46_68]HBK33982.1 hypothetical protein [Candidatus Uhrbacteria bacterium]HCB19146.1 hypothetical protein [Candidatus Uhrbacteria bacterium]
MAKKFDWDRVGLDFGNWEEEKIWALDLPVVEMDIADLIWHFDAPFWPSDHGERWAITPWDVIHEKEGTLNEQKNMEHADLKYPIDILQNKDRWLILDGIHRLAKSYKLGYSKVNVRMIPREKLSEIIVSDSIELP